MRTCIALLTFCLLLTACGGDTGATAGESTGSAPLDKAIADAETALGTTSSGNFCLGQEGKSVCDFLDDDLIMSYLPAGAEKNGYQDTKRGMLSSCGYSVEHPTKTVPLKVGSMNMNVPATYTVALSGINSYDSAKKARSRFQAGYRTMTAEEAAQTRKQLEEGIDAKLAKGEITAEQAKMAKSFGGAVGKANYVAVSGLGDMAVWGNALPDKEPETMGSLIVLSGDTYFSLEVDLLESRAHSKEAAIKIARAALAVCD